MLRVLGKAHDSVLIHTGQHYDPAMSDVFFRELAIPDPTHHLGVGSGSHAHQTAAMLMGLEPLLAERGADWVVVFGDTNTTLAGALAAAKSRLRVAHVEAGVRSYNRRMPEEQNRLVVDHLSALLLCPTQQAILNLAREGIVDRAFNVGDLMKESCLDLADRARRDSLVLSRLGLATGRYFLATVHRAENVDDSDKLARIFRGLEAIEDIVVVPLHPRTRRAIDLAGLRVAPRIRMIAPLGYLDMLCLQSHARVVLTDSGGLQREAAWLGVPCVVLRNETEWTDLVETGATRLAGADPARIARLARDAAPVRAAVAFTNDRPSVAIAQKLHDFR